MNNNESREGRLYVEFIRAGERYARLPPLTTREGGDLLSEITKHVETHLAAENVDVTAEPGNPRKFYIRWGYGQGCIALLTKIGGKS